MANICSICGKPARVTFTQTWVKTVDGVGEVGGWDSSESDIVEAHLCQSHADQFENDSEFRKEVVSIVTEP